MTLFYCLVLPAGFVTIRTKTLYNKYDPKSNRLPATVPNPNNF